MKKLLPILAVTLATFGTAFATSSPVMADDASKPQAPQLKFNGRYRVVSAKKAQAAIKVAIDKTVSEMFFIKRPFARSRLTDTNPVLVAMNFKFTGKKMHYLYNGNKLIDSTLDAPFHKWKSPTDGKTYQIKETIKGGVLIQTIKGSEGTKVERFKLSKDGKTLTYSVKVTSSQLPKPLRYHYNMRRR